MRIDVVPGLDQPAIRRMNTSTVLRALAEGPDEATLQSLVLSTGLSRRTVDLILTTLIEDGWASEIASEAVKSVGRPARRYTFAADRRLVAGVRLDTDFVTVQISDLRGAALRREVRALRDGGSPETTVEDAAATVRSALEAIGVAETRLAAGTVAAGGVIGLDGVVTRLFDAPDWSGYPLADAFAQAFTVPWHADNDANTGALAEYWSGAGKGRDSLAWLIHGRRTGVGVLLNGQLHHGAAGAAGELIESRVLNLRAGQDHPVAALTATEPEARAAALAIVQAAARGDAAASVLVDEMAHRIADLVDILAWTIAPELIVLGGGLEAAADELLPRVRRAVAATSAAHVQVIASSLGHDAPLQGAVRRALALVETDLYSAMSA